MIKTETIPSIVTWAEIKRHCAQHDDELQSLLENFALGSVESFERETGIAAGQRTITAAYHYDEIKCGKIILPKGPVISITSVQDITRTFSNTEYQLRKQGHNWYLHLYTSGNYPIVVTYEAGFETVPASIKNAVLIHTEHQRKYRGPTTEQQTYEVQHGLQRIYDNYNSMKFLIG